MQTGVFSSAMALAVVVFLGLAHRCAAQATGPDPDRVHIDNIQKALGLSARWMVNVQKESGLFQYQYQVAEAQFSDKDNIVRQTGTFYSLIALYGHQPAPDIQKAIDRFRAAILTLVKQDSTLALPVAYIETKGESKINTSALYVLALIELERVGLPLTPYEKAVLEALVRGILSMENRKDGGFWYYYNQPETANRVTPYGTGEALYALARYYRYIRPDTSIMDCCDRSFRAYYKLIGHEDFGSDNIRGFFPWALYYLAEREEAGFPGNYDYIVQLLQKALDFRKTNTACAETGCFRVKAIGEASFLEGVARNYRIVKQHDPALAAHLKTSYIDRMVGFFCSLQMKTGQDFETLTGRTYRGDLRYLAGGFCNAPDCTFFRNDFNQHASVALLNSLAYVYRPE